MWIDNEFLYRPGLGGNHNGDVKVDPKMYSFRYEKEDEREQKITEAMTQRVEGVADEGFGGTVIRSKHDGAGQIFGYQIPIKQESTLKKLQKGKGITNYTLGSTDPSGLYQAGYERHNLVKKKVKQERLRELERQRSKLTNPYEALKNKNK